MFQSITFIWYAAKCWISSWLGGRQLLFLLKSSLPLYRWVMFASGCNIKKLHKQFRKNSNYPLCASDYGCQQAFRGGEGLPVLHWLWAKTSFCCDSWGLCFICLFNQLDFHLHVNHFTPHHLFGVMFCFQICHSRWSPSESLNVPEVFFWSFSLHCRVLLTQEKVYTSLFLCVMGYSLT